MFDDRSGAATTPASAAPTEVVAEPLALAAADGFRLAATLVRPVARRPRAAVVVLGATAVRRRYYQRFAEALAAAGLATLTVDYRGVGDSRPERLRGFPGSMLDWARLDATAAFAALTTRHRDLPRFVVGHSFGGQALALCPPLAAADGAVLVAAQSGYFGHWPALSRVGMWITWTAWLPLLTALFGYLPHWAGLGEALPREVARQWGRWCRHPRYLFGHVPEAAAIAAAVRFPILALSFADDPFAPRPAVDWLLARYGAATVDHRCFDRRDSGGDAIGHFGYFRATHSALWPPVIDWLVARAAPPS